MAGWDCRCRLASGGSGTSRWSAGSHVSCLQVSRAHWRGCSCPARQGFHVPRHWSDEAVGTTVARRVPASDSPERYTQRSESIDVEAGRVARVQVVLDVDAIALNPIEVTVDRRDATLQDRGFYQRREDGWGYFVDREDLENWDPIDLTDALIRFPGVRIVSNPSSPGQRHLRLRSFGDESVPRPSTSTASG